MILTDDKIERLRDLVLADVPSEPRGYYFLEMTSGFVRFAEVVSWLVGVELPKSGVALLSASFNGGRVLVMGVSEIEPSAAKRLVKNMAPAIVGRIPYSVILCSEKKTALCIGYGGEWVYVSEPKNIDSTMIKDMLLQAFTVDRELNTQINSMVVYDGFDVGRRLIKAECRTLDGNADPDAMYMRKPMVGKKEEVLV